MVPSRPTTSLTAALLVFAVAAGCSSSAASSQSQPSSAPSSSQPSGSTAPAAGHYLPATGTTKAGLLFEQYRSPSPRYVLTYPGGWNVARKGSIVRIAKFGNAIVVAARKAKSAPKLDGIKAALKKQQKTGGLLAVTVTPRTLTLPAGKAVRMVFTESRAASATSAATTLIVSRYIFFHDGSVVVLSMLGPQAFDNRVAYAWIAKRFGWG